MNGANGGTASMPLADADQVDLAVHAEELSGQPTAVGLVPVEEVAAHPSVSQLRHLQHTATALSHALQAASGRLVQLDAGTRNKLVRGSCLTARNLAGQLRALADEADRVKWSGS